ncbi:MAG: hypothetical protein H3C34_10920 [Caldilineaceae bacterium]|nr:hypothetical protein [Caldilineaceae bacterium]
MHKFSSGGRRHLLVLGFYILLSLVLTWPLIRNLATHVPGVAQWAFDESTFVWNIWYFKSALIDQLSSPLHSELIWYPLGIDLVLYTYNFYHVLAAMPLALAANLPLASNITLLASTVLSGYGTWLLVTYLLARQGGPDHGRPAAHGQPAITWSAFLAGAVYAYASNRAVYAALGHYDMVTTQWIPFYALALLRAMDTALAPGRRRRWALFGGVFFALTGLAEMISALFLGMFTVVVLLIWLWRARRERPPGDELRGLVANLVILGGVAFVIWSPALLPILQAFVAADYDLKGWGDALILSADLRGWFSPTVFHPLFGGDVVQELRQVQARAANPDLAGFRDVNTVFLGWITFGLALIGALAYRRKVAIWIWTAVTFGVLTLGPLLQINGRSRFDIDGLETTVPLPYLLLHFVPVIKANRAPNRNSVLLMLGLAVLAGYGVYWLVTRLRQQGAEPSGQPRVLSAFQTAIAGGLAGLVIFEHLALPFPLSDARIPAVYRQIAADPNPVSVLQVPLGWRNSFGVFGSERTQLQYYQSAHGKPMLGGNISRAPDFKMDYFRRIPYFQALTETEFGHPVSPEQFDAARAQAGELMYLYNTAYVLLMPPIPGRPPYSDTWQASWDFVKSTLPLESEPFWTGDGIEAYRVLQPQGSDQFRLDLGTQGTYPYRGEGWDEAESDEPYGATATWATGKQSRLFVPLRSVQPGAVYNVQLQIHPFAYPGGPQQSVQLIANGQAFEKLPLQEGWQLVSWQVPGSALVDGLNWLELAWEYAAVPRAILPGSRQIGSTGVELPVDADMKAFEGGGFIALFDDEGNQRDGSAGRKGVNITVLDPGSSEVLDKAGFDTTASGAESDRLATYLAGIEPGFPALVVSYGDATAHLAPAAVDGLRTLGADVTLDSLRGNYFAIAGVKGAAPGSAAQAVDPAEAFLRVSLNRDRRMLAAAVDWLNVERGE